MNLGIFGGSFNPPHRGHLVAAKAFFEEAKLDRLLITVAGKPPHKELDEKCSDAHRLEMTRLNFLSMGERVTVSDIELMRRGKSYTYDTLCQLKELYPDDKLFLYCGSDMLLSFKKWYRYTDILKMCTLCVMKRLDCVPLWESSLKELKAEAPNGIIPITAPHYEESSTAVREELSKGSIPAGLVDEVADYIRQRGLYLAGS